MKIKVLEYPKVISTYHNSGLSNPRFRISIVDNRLEKDFEKHKRKIVNQMRKEVLPVVYSMLQFEEIVISSKDTQPWFSIVNGGGTGYAGFVIYNAPNKYHGYIYSIKLAYEDFEK